MAITYVSSSQSENLFLGQGTNAGLCSAVVHITASPAWTGSLRLTRRVTGTSQFMTSSYTKDLNGTVDNSPITGSGIFTMSATQSDIQLMHSMTISGSVSASVGLVQH